MNRAPSNDQPDAIGPATFIPVRFADPLTIRFPIKPSMKNSIPTEKSSDEIAQIQAALFQLAARIENDAPPAAIQTPFADLMLDKNKLNAVLQEIEKPEPYFSVPEQDVANGSEPESASAVNDASRSLSKSSSAQLIKAEFHLQAPSACSVKLAADFTDWEKHPLNLVKSEDGIWFTVVPLSPGQYAYRFIVDGQWRDDPHPARRVPNQFGTANAVVIVP